MQPVYRSGKLMMERLRAGADFKEFGALRASFATELSIVRDHMNADASAKDPLRAYYAAYQNVLDLYSFAARAWEWEISLDQCTGPYTGGDWAEDMKSGNMEKGMVELEAANAWNRRFKTCSASLDKILHEILQQADSTEIGCPVPVGPGDPIYMCALKRAETKMTAAEALLLKR